MASAPPTSFLGITDTEALFGQVLSDWWETTTDLIWPTSVITFGRMRHDPQLKAILNSYLLPITRSTWVVDPAGCRDEVVQLVADDLGISILGADKPGPARRRGIIWQRHLREALYCQLVYGYMPFERRYRFDSANRAHLDALGPRMPWTVARIDLNRDGTINQMVQDTQNTPLPASRLVWYVNDLQGAQWTGVSSLRACFGAWLLKHELWRVHATSIRRFGMGIPGVKAPAGATAAQVQHAQMLASAMRAGDTAGIGVPQGYEPFLMGLTGSVPDALAMIEYLDRVMAKQALAALIELGQTETGSRALGDTFMDLFLMSVQGVADEAAVTATSGQDGIPGIVTDLVDQNWGEDEPAPRVTCLDVGTQYELTAQAIQQLTEFGALQPDDSLDQWIRRQWHLPARTAPFFDPPASTPAAPRHDPPVAPAPEHAGTTPPAIAAGAGASSPASLLRRQPTKIEARSGFDPEEHQTVWQTSLDALLATYKRVADKQRDGIVDQVIATIKAGAVDALASIKVDATAGAAMILATMTSAWHAAVNAMIGEAEHQGVTIDPAKVKAPAGLAAIADGRAQIAATNLAQVAGSRAMRVIQQGRPVDEQAEEAGVNVAEWLDQLSDRGLRDQLGAALTAAQNAGRVAVLEAAPASAGTATYVASEILDINTCVPCQNEDGTIFSSFDDMAGAYPTGGFIDCDGDLRCRGTVVAVWGDISSTSDGGDDVAE